MLERQYANALLSKHWSGRTLPIDPAAIASAEGVRVSPFGWEELAAASGWYRLVDGQPVIYFNPAEVPTRQRFTIAHELGHHAMAHGPRPRDGAAAFNLMNYDPIEASANRFAAELLMPEATVRLMASNKNYASVQSLASAFNVSEVAMKYRLKNLGIIS